MLLKIYIATPDGVEQDQLEEADNIIGRELGDFTRYQVTGGEVHGIDVYTESTLVYELVRAEDTSRIDSNPLNDAVFELKLLFDQRDVLTTETPVTVRFK